MRCLIELSVEIESPVGGLEALMETVACACCEIEGLKNIEAGARLTGGEGIREINRTFRSIDKETDVLSFPSVAYPAGKTAGDCLTLLRRERNIETGRAHLGDFVISLPRAKAQAEEYGHSLRREIGYLTAHAMFHLMGYDHMTESDKRVMREKEERAMGNLSLTRGKDDPMTDQALYLMACEALKNAYAPYSNFRVGACLLSEDGRAFGGCNIENASYGASICAERCAVSAALSQGARRFTAIAVVGEETDAWPCGICRQVLNEFSVGLRVLCGSVKSGKFLVVPLSDLLPNAFGPEDLHK